MSGKPQNIYDDPDEDIALDLLGVFLGCVIVVGVYRSLQIPIRAQGQNAPDDPEDEAENDQRQIAALAWHLVHETATPFSVEMVKACMLSII